MKDPLMRAYAIIGVSVAIIAGTLTGTGANARACTHRHPCPTPTPTVTPSPTPVPDEAPGTVLFNDDFTGPAGTAPDAANWTLFTGDREWAFTTSPVAAKNMFLDGNGNLVLRVRREPQGVPVYNGTTAHYSGAFMGTFGYGTGWPPTGVKFAANLPIHIEVRALMPPSAGLWSILWAMPTDRAQSQTIAELDFGEERLTRPTEAGCHQHVWLNGTDTRPWDGYLQVPDMTRNWHTYTADVTTTNVVYKVDGVLCGTAPGVVGRFGILLDNKVAPPGSWGAAGGSPDPADPGPWDTLVDRVTVTAG